MCTGLQANGDSFSIGTNIGVIAGQAIGEPSTQLSMNAFHTGGIAKGRGAESTSKFKRLANILTMPKTVPGSATLALSSGTVEKVTKPPQGGHEIYIKGVKHYVPSGLDLKIKKGSRVSRGDALSEGIVNPKQLLPLKGMQAVQDHLAGELHGLMRTVTPVRRRNSEITVKAITNLTRIEDPGDHPEWVVGDLRPYSKVRAWNKRRKKSSVVRHEPILKGVDVLPLNMQEDWLAMMNYNDLSRNFIRAAQQGFRSNLHGFHPVPALAYAKEFGKKVSVKEFKGQY